MAQFLKGDWDLCEDPQEVRWDWPVLIFPTLGDGFCPQRDHTQTHTDHFVSAHRSLISIFLYKSTTNDGSPGLGPCAMASLSDFTNGAEKILPLRGLS